MPQDRPQRRKYSRSLSPIPIKHKRSWQNDVPSAAGGDARRSQRPRSPFRRDKHFKSPLKFHDHKDYRPHSDSHKHRSPPPQGHKRPRPRSPYSAQPSSYTRHTPASPGRDHGRKEPRIDHSGDRPDSQAQPRATSSRPLSKLNVDRTKQDEPFPKSSQGEAVEKKKHQGSVSPPIKRKKSVSPAPKKPEATQPPKVATEKKGTSSGKKKTSRITLHKRFTLEDQEPFELVDNVTIAILRNPNAEPSEDVTVKKVFDPSMFKMVHKKNEGRRPIFDREEIKVWRHDENLTDDPDFERRLVRVKSTTSATKPSSDSLARMSPDMIRKAFGIQIGGKSGSKSPHRSRSPHREPQIRLDPRPDPRYESKFREQLEREKGKRNVRKSDEYPGGDIFDTRRNDRGKGETYDLRQALEKRRNDRGDASGFRIEVQRGEVDPGAELYYREDNPRRFSSPSSAPRNVVLDQEKVHRRFDSLDRDSTGSWDNDRRTVRRGRGGFGRVRRPAWSPGAGDVVEDMRRDDMRDRRPRYSVSPSRGHRKQGWRGPRGRGRGRGRHYMPYDEGITSPTEIDDSFKYTQHDDRDVSPKPFRGRGRPRLPTRSFGSSNFRMMSRGGFRGGPKGGRGFRGGYKGGYRPLADRRSVERMANSLEREWKHDMYDSLQSEEEQPHSTTLGN